MAGCAGLPLVVAGDRQQVQGRRVGRTGDGRLAAQPNDAGILAGSVQS
jgi:hypothetical protein